MVEGENEDKDAHSASEAENQFLIFKKADKPVNLFSISH